MRHKISSNEHIDVWAVIGSSELCSRSPTFDLGHVVGVCMAPCSFRLTKCKTDKQAEACAHPCNQLGNHCSCANQGEGNGPP